MTTPSQNNQSGLRALPDFLKYSFIIKTNYHGQNRIKCSFFI